MAVQENNLFNQPSPEDAELNTIISESMGNPQPQYTREDQEESEAIKTAQVLQENKNAVIALQNQPAQVIRLDLEKIQEQFDDIQAFNKMLLDNLIPEVDYNYVPGTHTVMIYKPGLEKVQTLTKHIVRYECLDEVLIDNGKTGEYKVKTICIIATHNNQKMSQGNAICGTHDKKLYYESKPKTDIEKRFKTRGIYDPATDSFIPVEELEEDGNRYKVPKSVSALKEQCHLVESKANIRAKRAAINNYIAGSSLLPELKAKLDAYLAGENGATKSEKPVKNNSNQQNCSECGESLTEKVAKFSQKKLGRSLCFNCQQKYKAS